MDTKEIVLASDVTNDVLVYDIETKTFGMPDATKDRLRLFGCYSYKTNKYYLLSSVEDIQKVIDAHKFLVGFNTESYDAPILKREGISFEYKIQIDLYDIFKKRAGGMKIDKGMLKDLLISYSLDFITRTIGITNEEDSKMKIDYKLFQKDSWTTDEMDLVKKYTIRDIEVTKKLYQWVEEYFSGFRDFINEEDVRKKRYLTVSIAKFTYKAICKEMKWTEEYGTTANDDEESIAGGYVSYPAGEEFHSDDKGSMYLMDFQSEYPHAMMQANLYGRKKLGEINNRPIWNGGGVWKVEGIYYADEMHHVGKLIQKWFNDRLEYKKVKDKREYTIKIILNTIYGILNNPYYIRVYDKVAGGDCTRLGRQWVKYGRKVFRDKGYKVIYTDTDSIYVKDDYNNKEEVMKIKQDIIDFIKSTVPFPQDTYTMVYEAEIKHMYFFKGGGEKDTDIEMDEDDFINRPKGFMKKNYIYVTTDNKLEIKNLGIRKKSNSPLSKEIFWNHLVPKIKEGQIKFSRVMIKNLIESELQKDINIVAMRKEVGPIQQYKDNPGTIQGQISSKYGAGIHFLIANTKNIGVGKGVSMCTIEEFKSHNLKIDDIDLDTVWSELDYFIKAPVTKNIFQF